MYQSLDMFSTSMAMARHAGARQAVSSANVANADTPGFRAQALPGFAEAYDSPVGRLGLRQTRAEHLGIGQGHLALKVADAGGEAAPNGNTVSLETEMLTGAEIRSEHNRALAIYRHAIGLIRTSLG
ncbi:FlgB family protein [Pseudoroseicyclus aestuarii]|uniref:Flagellar basal-body rod protein FlgB n=1 Tax=Pseudoroseicyclus aestuarii TaxID=1795041 RepID=A0A318SXM4_9RHOB|nr:FlgB family protein [Pseudoroseicyclus aestuarii]PYE84577.1 flagellar basal-body rod protein FlgB [Pseudoroseicyclus aestuarii]